MVRVWLGIDSQVKKGPMFFWGAAKNAKNLKSIAFFKFSPPIIMRCWGW